MRDPERGRRKEEKRREEEEGRGITGTSPSSDSSKTRLSECASSRERENQTGKKKLRHDGKALGLSIRFSFGLLRTFPSPVSASSSSPASRFGATTS